IYLQKTDLINVSYERFIDESSGDNVPTGQTIGDVRSRILNNIELKNIGLVSSYIGSRYDVALIFHVSNPVRNEILVDILVKLCLYDIIRRNAARKVPTDAKEDYDTAMELLVKIATGRLPLAGLPTPTDDNGNP